MINNNNKSSAKNNNKEEVIIHHSNSNTNNNQQDSKVFATTQLITQPIIINNQSTLQDFTEEDAAERQVEDQIAEEELCFICLDTLQEDDPQQEDFVEPCTELPCTNARCRQKKVHAKCIYEWKQTNRRNVSEASASSEESAVASCPLCRGELMTFDYFPPDLIGSAKFNNLQIRKAFLSKPVCPKAGFVRCFIRLNHLPKEDQAQGSSSTSTSKVISYDSKFHPGAKVDVGVYELYLQAPTTLKYPLGPVPDQSSPKAGDLLLAFGTRTRYPKIGTKRGADSKSFTKSDISTPVSQVDLYLTNQSFEPVISSIGEHYIATVKSSFSGFKHEVLLPLEPPRKSSAGVQHSVMDYEDTCCVHFIQNRPCVKNRSAPGPRKIQVCLPKVRNLIEPEASEQQQLHEQVDESDPAITPLQNIRRRPSTLSHALTYKSLNMQYEGVLPGEFSFGRNKEPYWLESLKAYSLDFKGRVTMPSNKNFQLIVDLDEEQKKCELLREGTENVVPELMRDKLSKGESEHDHIALQFGKVGEDADGEVFTMDFRWPLTPLQAFGICLGACDRNLTVV